MSSNSVSLDYMKPLISGGVAAGLDMFYLGESNTTKSMTFGVAVAAGTFVGGMVGNFAPDINLPILGSGKGLEQRVLEIGAGAGTSYAVNKYILKNVAYREDMTQKLGVIVVADLAAELVCDFLAGRPLSVFS